MITLQRRRGLVLVGEGEKITLMDWVPHGTTLECFWTGTKLAEVHSESFLLSPHYHCRAAGASTDDSVLTAN